MAGDPDVGAVKVFTRLSAEAVYAGITPFLQGPKGAFAAATSPAYLIVLRGAGHFAWVNCGERHTTQSCLQDVTNMRLATDYGIAFFNRYLRGESQPLLQGTATALAAFHTK